MDMNVKNNIQLVYQLCAHCCCSHILFIVLEGPRKLALLSGVTV